MQKRLLATPLFTVEHRVYPCSGRAPIERDVVVHPGAVVVLPLLDDDRIVMIRNYRFAIEKELWELPAGTLEPGEAPIKTAGRELEEETGYRAGKIEPLMAFFTTPGICTEWMHAFVATDLTAVGQNLEQDERIEVEIVDLADARRKMMDGKFEDAKTIAVLGRYFLGCT